MTAEVAILNRNAVALAADSAVTLQHPEGSKIYLTNKLFSLSSYQPVGIMVYGSAQLMGVPWETAIKQYRAEIGARAFPKLEQYASHFLKFIENNRLLFSNDQQKEHCYLLVRAWLHHLTELFINAMQQILQSRKTAISEPEARAIFRKIVRTEIQLVEKRPLFPRFREANAGALRRNCMVHIRRAINDELQTLKGAISDRELVRGCLLTITHAAHTRSQSGIVIAGFGDKELFPALRCYLADGVVAGRLRAFEPKQKQARIGPTSVTAVVMAFAQSEMVSLFMNGIDDGFEDFLMAYVQKILCDGYPSVLNKLLSEDVASNKLQEIVQRLRKAGSDLASELRSQMQDYQSKNHSEPIVEIVDYLPKEELAAMAEALVNLTSFKRHVTRQAETVGGPIDVAVISRGDGFIWIKRKHYFQKDLNPQFMARYYGGTK
ncbi:MAG TPA: hypothetical protein VGR72_12090 [Candidatus Acidoferrales bacterium]|nr:hypothetical protein [Candidatus Acidoferrales bacterium]